MKFVARWKDLGASEDFTLANDTEQGAESWLFQRLREWAEHVQIEDEAGRVVVSDSELRHRWKTRRS